MTWAKRVAFSPDGGVAYRPGQVIVRGADAVKAGALLEALGVWTPPARSPATKGDGPENAPGSPILNDAYRKLEGVSDPLGAVAMLSNAKIYAQVNHVLFATSLEANPFYANPFYANPFYANPFYANPFHANPFYANPFYANPFYANPSPGGQTVPPAPVNRHPGSDPQLREAGPQTSSARPAKTPVWADMDRKKKDGAPRVVIVDTDYAEKKDVIPFTPVGLTATHYTDKPDTDNRGEKGHPYLDPAAGHATFIAGVIERVAPGCTIDVEKVIGPEGDGDEESIAENLGSLANGSNPRLLVNLSFGGYTSDKMEVLATAVADLHASGAAIIASAGNDGTWVPMYPAAFDEVIGVAALAPDGTKASFSNYGPWVSASTYGVNVVSSFFKDFHGGIGPDQPAEFQGWARWSGTSFAAPRVAALLAKRMMKKKTMTAHAAVRRMIGKKVEDRDPMLGVRFL